MRGKCLEDDEETPTPIIVAAPGRGALYLGSVKDARNILRLQALGITHVLNMARPLYDESIFAGSITYLSFDAHDADDYPLVTHFLPAISFIHNALTDKGAVLVHCASGVSRSACVVMAYLMWANEWSPERSALFVHSKRLCACPNMGFLQALCAWECPKDVGL